MSFSIPTLKAYRIITTGGGVVPADPTFSVGVSCAGFNSVLNGFFSTATVGSSLVYTINGDTPIYGVYGTNIPCQTGFFVNTTPANSCEQQNIGTSICPSVTTIKAIAYLNGQSSNVTSTTTCRTCPGSLTAPTANQPTCPNGDSVQGCLGGSISFLFTGAGGGCSVLRYTIAEGSAPPDPTIDSNTATAGTPIIYNGTTVGTPATPVYIKAAFFDPSCNLSSTVTSSSYGYKYP